MSKSMFDPSLMAKSMSSTKTDYSEKNVPHEYLKGSDALSADNPADVPYEEWARAFRRRKDYEDWLNGEICEKHFGRNRD